MFSELVAPYKVKGLTLKSVRDITGLDWVHIEQKSDLPDDRGIYGWFDPEAPYTMVYHGSGAGAGGLRGRLANQLRWKANQAARIGDFEVAQNQTEDHGYNIAAESPVIRESAERGLLLYVAVAKPAIWSVETGLSVPETAGAWESFLYAASHLSTGRRSILGGGAWENKPSSLAQHMASVAWDRLVAVSSDWRN